MNLARIARLKFPSLIVAVGLLLGLIGDLLLYGKPVGISFPTLIGLLMIGLFTLACVEKTPLVWANLWLVVPLLYLAVMSMVRAAPFLRFLNIAGTLLLTLLLANRLATRPVTHLNVGGYVGALLEGGVLSALIPFPLLNRGIKDLRQHGGSRDMARRVAFGLLIAAPFLCIFTLLFASADLLFNKYLGDILDAFNLPDLIGHSFLTLVLTWAAMGLLAYALTRDAEWTDMFSVKPSAGGEAAGEDDAAQTPESGQAAEAKPAARPVKLGVVEASVVLFSINLLFLIFVAIQFAALFGGEAFLARQGLTYSEYARRGFFQLLTVALITLALILILDATTRRETERQRAVFLLGCGLMIAMTIIILASAFMRLGLYEAAYGFTRLRTHSHVLMAWIAILLAAFLVLLVTRRTALFATVALVVAIGFTVTLDVMNPDVFILRQNLQRYARGEELDVGYVGSLSEDVTPYLVPLLHAYGPEVREMAGPWLRYHLEQLDERQEKAGWPSYHVGYSQAYRALDANRALIEQYETAMPWETYLTRSDLE
jgi:hypothetical protein